MKTLGIIGGLGPMATAYLLQLIIEMTDAKTDQEHLDVIVFDRPSTPDRTAYLLDNTKPSPLPSMMHTAQTLQQLGAGVLCAPCVTSHAFYTQLAESVEIPFLNMVTETAAELRAAGCKKVGIMATTGTVRTGLFQSALTQAGITPVIPSEQTQQLVMSIIYDEIKAGKPADPQKFQLISAELTAAGCESIILGCTELSLIKKESGLTTGYLDALEVLAKRSVQVCGGKLKPQYQHLTS